MLHVITMILIWRWAKGMDQRVQTAIKMSLAIASSEDGRRDPVLRQRHPMRQKTSRTSFLLVLPEGHGRQPSSGFSAMRAHSELWNRKSMVLCHNRQMKPRLGTNWNPTEFFFLIPPFSENSNRPPLELTFTPTSWVALGKHSISLSHVCKTGLWWPGWYGDLGAPYFYYM